MSTQLHAPPTEAEYVDVDEWGVPGANGAVRVWIEHDGWCSACRANPAHVAHMGNEARNFALCHPCLTRLHAVFSALPSTCAVPLRSTDR